MLYIYNYTDIPMERIDLRYYDDKQKLHQLMREKGFILKELDEIVRATTNAQKLSQKIDAEHEMRRKYFSDQESLLKAFMRDVMGDTGPKLPQSRMGRAEPMYLVENYDRMHAIERYVATGNVMDGMDMEEAKLARMKFEAMFA